MSQLKVVSPTAIPRPPGSITIDPIERASPESGWVKQLVPAIETLDRKHVDIANSVSARVTSLERGISDVRVSYIQGSPVILEVDAKSTIYFVRTVAGTVVITLPPFEKLPGKQFTFKKIDAANTLTLRAGSGLVEGAATFSWTTQYMSRTLVSDGTTGWWVV